MKKLKEQMFIRALALHLPEEVYDQFTDKLEEWIADNFSPLDAMVSLPIELEKMIKGIIEIPIFIPELKNNMSYSFMFERIKQLKECYELTKAT